MTDRLYRSRDDRMIAGVAGGLAEQLGLDPSLVRVGWVVLAIVTGGLLALVYVVMMIVVPEEPGADRWTGWANPSSADRSPPDARGAPPQRDTAPTRDSGAEPTAGAEAEAAPAPATARAPLAAEPTGDRPTETIPPPAGPSPASARPASPSASAWAAADDARATARDERAAARDERAAARAERRQARAERRAARRESSSGPILLGILLVLVGAWLLARRYLPGAEFDRLWPVALVVVGLVLVVLSFRPGREP